MRTLYSALKSSQDYIVICFYVSVYKYMLFCDFKTKRILEIKGNSEDRDRNLHKSNDIIKISEMQKKHK